MFSFLSIFRFGPIQLSCCPMKAPHAVASGRILMRGDVHKRLYLGRSVQTLDTRRYLVSQIIQTARRADQAAKRDAYNFGEMA